MFQLWLLFCLPCQSQPADFSSRIPEWRKPGRCGTNALYVYLKLSGHLVQYDEVASVVPTDAARGCSLADLSEAASHFDARTEVRKVTIEDLPGISTPFIAHLDNLDQGGAGHFITVYHIGGDRDARVVCYIDGSSALEHFIMLPELDHQFSGYVLVPSRSYFSSGIVLTSIGCVLGTALGLLLALRKPPEKVLPLKN